VKSAAGIGAILLRGISDTIRVSLLGDPVPEIAAAFDILRSTDRRVTRPEVVACPTCGRLDIDLERIVAEVESKMAHLKNPLRISILGCLVNGFGEAREADLGIAAGAGKGVIFKKGVPIRHVLEADMVQALLEEVERFHEDTPPLKPAAAKKIAALTVLG
jgi:(E)-4-hydroxy-3-methylbut-2-enyl-diphosphate synthase